MTSLTAWLLGQLGKQVAPGCNCISFCDRAITREHECLVACPFGCVQLDILPRRSRWFRSCVLAKYLFKSVQAPLDGTPTERQRNSQSVSCSRHPSQPLAALGLLPLEHTGCIWEKQGGFKGILSRLETGGRGENWRPWFRLLLRSPPLTHQRGSLLPS